MHLAPAGYGEIGNQTYLRRDVGSSSSRSTWTNHANDSNSTTVSRGSYESQFDLTAVIEAIDQKAVASGGFASVYMARCNGSKVALKAIRVIQDSMHTAQRRLIREVHVWKTLDHKNIAPLLGVADCPHLSPLAAMITPWYKNGSAMEYLRRERLTYGNRLALAIGVARGLEYLHDLNPAIVHGDLKPSNILIDDQRRPRICDFGLARIISEETGTGLTTTTRHNATPLYAAPEILMASDDGPAFEPSLASDVYSLGSLIYEFLTGSQPYLHTRTSTHVLVAVVKGDKPATRPPSIDDMAGRLQWDLFESCWELKPEARPNIHQVVAKLEAIGHEYGKQDLPPKTAKTAQSIGTLIVVILRAKNLLDRRTIGKQDPYCTVELHGHRKQTNTIRRGGQHPEWDEEFRFELFEDDDTLDSQLQPPNSHVKIKGGTSMKLECHANHTLGQKLVGETKIDIGMVFTKGEIDEWFTLSNGDMYAGEVYLELTFYAKERPLEKKRAHSSTRDIGRRAGQSSRSAAVSRNISHKPLSTSRSLPSLKPKNQPTSEPPPLPMPLLPVTHRYRSPSPFEYQQADPSFHPSYGLPVQPHYNTNNEVEWRGYGMMPSQSIAQDSLLRPSVNLQGNQGPQNHSNTSSWPTPFPDAVGVYSTGPAFEDPYSQYPATYRQYYMTS